MMYRTFFGLCVACYMLAACASSAPQQETGAVALPPEETEEASPPPYILRVLATSVFEEEATVRIDHLMIDGVAQREGEALETPFEIPVFGKTFSAQFMHIAGVAKVRLVLLRDGHIVGVSPGTRVCASAKGISFAFGCR